jgi:large subunit ribosomal protein L6
MSRIGKKPIAIPSGVEVSVAGTIVNVKKGNKTIPVETHGRVETKIENNEIVLEKVGETKESSAFWGTYRALINNAVVGLDAGFQKSLEINGVGYRAAVKGNVLELQLGYSHPINYDIPEGLDISVKYTDEHIVRKAGKTAK